MEPQNAYPTQCATFTFRRGEHVLRHVKKCSYAGDVCPVSLSTCALLRKSFQAEGVDRNLDLSGEIIQQTLTVWRGEMRAKSRC